MVTPRRQLRAAQHSEAVEQEASCIPQEQELEVQDQLEPEQLPSVGPVLVPERQELVVEHQPQLLRPVQSPQLPASMQGSAGPEHSLDSHDHSVEAQLPMSGPVLVPRLQVPLAPHQPHT